MTRQRRTFVASVIALVASLPAMAAADTLSVRDAWIRDAPPTAPSRAGYATLVNSGDAPLRLVGASSPCFAEVEMHEMSMAGGVMRMRALDGVDIAPGATVAFAPGGNHFMMLKPMRALAAGETCRVELRFDGGVTQTVEFLLRR
jgi:copper(I)-binding protein